MSSSGRFTESSLKTNLSTVNEAALCEYSNLLALGYLATSGGKGNLDGWRFLSAIPSTAIPAAITLDLSTRSRKSLSACYAVAGTDFTFFLLIREWSEISVQLSPSDFSEKNVLKDKLQRGKYNIKNISNIFIQLRFNF